MLSSTIYKSLLNDQPTRDVFMVVAKAKSIRRAEITRQIDPKSMKAELDEVLRELEKEDLIKVKEGPIPELRLYYLTAKGVAAGEELAK